MYFPLGLVFKVDNLIPRWRSVLPRYIFTCAWCFRWTIPYLDEDQQEKGELLLYKLESLGKVDIKYNPYDWSLNKSWLVHVLRDWPGLSPLCKSAALATYTPRHLRTSTSISLYLYLYPFLFYMMCINWASCQLVFESLVSKSYCSCLKMFFKHIRGKTTSTCRVMLFRPFLALILNTQLCIVVSSFHCGCSIPTTCYLLCQ